MYFQQILGQTKAIDFLEHAISNERLATAYLFTGQHGIGKRKTAFAMAKTLHCHNHWATEYAQLIDEQQFADVRQIAPEGKFIKISQIQQTLDWLSLTPVHGKYKCLLIDQAEAMNKEAANAFLKTLEEPPPDTLFILIAEHAGQLLETVVSRCQMVRFSPLSATIIQEILQKDFSLSSSEIQFLSRFFMGHIDVEWIKKIENIQKWQDEFFECLHALFAGNMVLLLEHLEKWNTSKEEAWRFVMIFMECWCRDVVQLQQKSSSFLYHYKYSAQLEKAAHALPTHKILQASQEIYVAREAIFFNANRSLTIQKLWFEWKTLFLTK